MNLKIEHPILGSVRLTVLELYTNGDLNGVRLVLTDSQNYRLGEVDIAISNRGDCLEALTDYAATEIATLEIGLGASPDW